MKLAEDAKRILGIEIETEEVLRKACARIKELRQSPCVTCVEFVPQVYQIGLEFAIILRTSTLPLTPKIVADEVGCSEHELYKMKIFYEKTKENLNKVFRTR